MFKRNDEYVTLCEFQMARLFVQYLVIFKNENSPKLSRTFAKSSKMADVQNFAKCGWWCDGLPRLLVLGFKSCLIISLYIILWVKLMF